MYVNERWSNPGHVTVKEQRCTEDVELLAVSIRPYYLVREFPHVPVITVDIPPSADAAAACELIHSVVSEQQTAHPQALILISYFNHAPLSATLPTFTQYVDCFTRNNKTLDLLYANTQDAHSSPLRCLVARGAVGVPGDLFPSGPDTRGRWPPSLAGRSLLGPLYLVGRPGYLAESNEETRIIMKLILLLTHIVNLLFSAVSLVSLSLINCNPTLFLFVLVLLLFVLSCVLQKNNIKKNCRLPWQQICKSLLW